MLAIFRTSYCWPENRLISAQCFIEQVDSGSSWKLLEQYYKQETKLLLQQLYQKDYKEDYVLSSHIQSLIFNLIKLQFSILSEQKLGSGLVYKPDLKLELKMQFIGLDLMVNYRLINLENEIHWEYGRGQNKGVCKHSVHSLFCKSQFGE